MKPPLIHLEKYNIVLASQSPRRKELLEGLSLNFEIRKGIDVDESFSTDIPVTEVAEYLSRKKADAYKKTMDSNDLIITSDTIVLTDNVILGKPKNHEEAKKMIQMLSGRTHQVITGVTLVSKQKEVSFSVSTEVTFAELSDYEIDFYIVTYQPYDKAGAYGIQEWIGFIGVSQLNGSYFNVMGLPVQRLYSELKNF